MHTYGMAYSDIKTACLDHCCISNVAHSLSSSYIAQANCHWLTHNHEKTNNMACATSEKSVRLIVYSFEVGIQMDQYSQERAENIINKLTG